MNTSNIIIALEIMAKGMAGIFTAILIILLCSDKPDGKGLYNWDKGHVGIGGNCNGADIFGIQDLGYQNGSRDVYKRQMYNR